MPVVAAPSRASFAFLGYKEGCETRFSVIWQPCSRIEQKGTDSTYALQGDEQVLQATSSEDDDDWGILGQSPI